jgi:hypothetical protein
VAPLSARAVTAAQLNAEHHLSTRVPCHPAWPRPVARFSGVIRVSERLGDLSLIAIRNWTDGLSQISFLGNKLR